MAHTIGIDGKLYYDATGAGVGSWTELTNAQDVRLPMSKSEADVTTRANNGFRAIVGVLKEVSVEFTMIYDPTEAGWVAMNAAFFADTIIGIAVMDGDIVTPGTEGFQADFEILTFEEDQSMEEAMKTNVVAKISFSSFTPAWTTITT